MVGKQEARANNVCNIWYSTLQGYYWFLCRRFQYLLESAVTDIGWENGLSHLDLYFSCSNRSTGTFFTCQLQFNKTFCNQVVCQSPLSVIVGVTYFMMCETSKKYIKCKSPEGLILSSSVYLYNI